ncbi:membrane-associated protein, putative, partial [Bodo saltans]
MFAMAHHSCVNHFAIIFSVLALLTICTSAVVSPTQPQSKSHSSSFTFSQSATSSAVTITAPSSASTSLTASSTSTSSVADSTSTSESTTISQSLSHSSTAEKTSSTTKSTTLTGTTSLTGSTTMSNDASRSRSTSATSSSSRSASPTRSRSAEAASTTQSVSRTPSSTITESPVASFTPSSSMTPSLEPTSSPSNTATPIPPPTRSNTRSTTVSQSVSRTSSSSPSVALSRSITLSTSNTPTLSITSSLSLTAEFSRSKSVSSTASLSSSITKSFNITKSEASFSVSVTKSLTPSGRSASSILSLTSSPVKTRSMNSSTISNSISVTQLVSHSITISASPSGSVSRSRSLTGTLTGSISTTASGGTRSVTPSSATSASLTQPPTRTRTLALTRSLTLSSTISNSISVSVSGSVSLTLTESNSLSLSQSLTHQVTFTTSLTPSMTTSMSNSSLLSGSESTSSSQSRDVTSSVSDTKSQNVSSSRGSSTVSLSITLSMSQSTSPSSTSPQSHSDSITRTAPTISGSSTGNITVSNLVTKSVSESEQGSVTKSPTSSLSVSFSVSVSRSLSKMLSASLASVSGSGSVSSTANVSATDSRDPTTTATTTVTDRRTISFSPEETMSKSKSQITLTQTESNERSRTRTQPTSSKTFEHPITTSVPLIWRETGTLRFLRRPTRYAAPFRPIPIAPTLIFQLRGLAAIGEQIYKSPVGLWCYMKITSVATRQDSSQPWENIAQNNSRFFGVWLQGLRTFPMVQSVCTFPNFNFQVPLAPAFDEQRQTGDVFQLTTEYLVGVSFCANTSKMIDPRVPVHPCNSSLFHVAACPYTSEAVYAVTTNPSPLLMCDVVGLNGTVNLQAPPYASIFASNRSGNGKLVLELVGGSFEYSTLRNAYSCALTDDVDDLYGNYTVSGRRVYSADSYLIDMCHLRCIFDEPPYASIFASNRSGNGKLVLELVGGSFEYSTLRNSYSCALTDDVEDLYGNYTVSGRHVYSADSYLIDMCHLRCIFDESSWSTLALFPSTNVTTTSGWDTHRMASSALLAKVELLDHAIPVPSTCTGDSRRIPLASLEQPGMKDVTSELLSCTAINQPHTVTVSQYQQAGSTASSVSLQNTTTRIVDFVPTSCFLRVIGSLEPRKFLVQSSRVANDAPITLRKNQTSVEGMVVYVGLCDAAGNAYPINLLNVTMNSTVRFVNVAITSTMSVAGAAVTVPGVNVTSQIVGSYGIVMNVVDDGPIFLFENLQLPTPPFGADGAASGCNTPNSWTVPSTATSLSTRGSTGASITNVTIGSSYRTPLVLFPSSIFGMPLYAPVCVSVVVGEVTGIVLLNSDAIMRITDTASSLYVTPILSITDALGNAINSTSAITIAFPMNLSVVVIQPTSTSTAQREFSTLTTNSSEEIVVVNGVACEVVSAIPPVVYVGVTTFPFALTGVVVSQPGANFSIWVRGTQHSSASLITGVTVNVSTVLWETTTQSSNTPAFPLLLANYSITSSFCPAGSGISTPFSVEQLIYVANSNPCPGNMGTTNISYNNTFPTVGGDTIIRGSGFSYFRASTMRCHLSNWNQLFSASAAATGADPPGASKVTFVSSCEVRCTLPAQPYPINPSSSFAYNSQGQLVRSSTVSTNQVGQFRLRGGPLQWSSPSIALRVVGPPRQMDVRGWSTTLQNSLLLVIPTFSVVMLDATGSDLTGLDFSTVFRSRTITLSYTPSSSGQLNGTSAISVSATTCSPYNGVAVFDPISIAPTSGEYSLTLDGRQLTEYVLLLTIVDNVTLDHNLKLLSPFPLCFVSVTLDRQSTLNGLFPVPVLIGAFRRNTSLDTNSVDTAVTNVRIFAQVTRDPDSPLPSFYDGSLVELGVDLDDCNNDYGNCGYLDAGVLTFSSFRFTGIPGVWYLIMIRPQNASLALSNASFKVRVPYCPVNVTTGNLTAQIQTLNNSLTLPSGGLAVKGWQFTIPGAMQTANSIVNFMS